MKKFPIILATAAVVMIVGTLAYKIFNGPLKDSRDGKTYKTVKIGNQVWMAENLNFEYNVGSAQSYCYEDKPENCQKYGRLYPWAAAMDSAALFSSNGQGCGTGKTCTTTEDVRGICPEGWVLPTIKDWNELFKAVGGQAVAGTKLKSTFGWKKDRNGTDDFSFNAIPAGNEYCQGDHRFFNAGEHTFFWSSTEDNDRAAYQMRLSHYLDNSWLESRFGKSCGYSVRCIKKRDRKPKIEPTTATDSIIDYRDGQTYKTVKIGDQTWMAENLNYDYNVGSAKSYCYHNNQQYCNKYGRLYTWAAAIDSAAIFSKDAKDCGIGNDNCWLIPPIQGACPEGWHVPSFAELAILIAEVNRVTPEIRSLFATYGWKGYAQGTDLFSFSLFPAGYRSYQSGRFEQEGYIAYLWSSDSFDGWSTESYYAAYRIFWMIEPTSKDIDKRDALSIRCIKD